MAIALCTTRCRTATEVAMMDEVKTKTAVMMPKGAVSSVGLAILAAVRAVTVATMNRTPKMMAQILIRCNALTDSPDTALLRAT